jgi:hypothetical protein
MKPVFLQILFFNFDFSEISGPIHRIFVEDFSNLFLLIRSYFFFSTSCLILADNMTIKRGGSPGVASNEDEVRDRTGLGRTNKTISFMFTVSSIFVSVGHSFRGQHSREHFESVNDFLMSELNLDLVVDPSDSFSRSRQSIEEERNMIYLQFIHEFR